MTLASAPRHPARRTHGRRLLHAGHAAAAERQVRFSPKPAASAQTVGEPWPRVLTENPYQRLGGRAWLAIEFGPDGSIMRVTVRRGGTRVVHDLLDYGRELGGDAPARAGVVLIEPGRIVAVYYRSSTSYHNH